MSFADVDERVGNSVLSDSDYRSGIPSERGEICALIPSETFIPLKISQPSGQACLAPISDQGSLLFADGYDGAILGVAEINGAASVVYGTEKVLTILCDRDGMTRADAQGFFAYNIAGAFMDES